MTHRKRPMPDDPTDSMIKIVPALPEHEAMIRAQSAQTNATHRARLPHVFGPTNDYQTSLLDMAFAPQAQENSRYRNQLWVACRDDDTPLGFVLVIWTPEPEGAGGCSALIADIATFDGARGQGVGRALLSHIAGQMAPNGWNTVIADVWHGNTASHALFAGAGFTPERTEYRLGTPPPLTDKPTDHSPKTARNRWVILAIGLLIVLIITSIP